MKRRPFLLYHWSPRSRRKSILRQGLCPGKPSLDASWRPPYICFCRFPNSAWALSATHSSKRQQWDLWAVWSDSARPYRTVNNARHPKSAWWLSEYRCKHSIWTRHVIYIGTRLRDPSKRWRP